MRTLLLFAFLTATHFGFSQTLKTDNLDLNSGGIIYDVVYDNYSNAFIVVGDFTSIQGVPRQNLALIDASTFTVQAEAPITSINGPIRTVALTREFLFPSPNRNNLILGGDFTNINGNTRLYICQFRKVEPVSPPFNSSYIFDTSWDAEIYNNFIPSDKINDLVVKGDTIIAVGMFSVYSGISSYATFDFGGVLPFKANEDIFIEVNIFNAFRAGNNNTEYYQIEAFENEFYLTGEIDFKRFNSDGVLQNIIANCNTNQSHRFSIHPTDQDTLIFGQVEFAGGSSIATYLKDGSLYNCPVSNPNPYVLQNGTNNEAEGFTAIYNGNIYVAEQDEVLSFNRNGVNPIQPTQSLTTNLNWYPDISNGFRPQRIQVVNDKLFIYGENLTSINGQSHQGLAAFCLPPKDAEDFTTLDTVVCQDEQAIYSIPVSEYATGYKWSYTGSGVQFRVAGTGASFEALGSNYVENTNAHSVEIYYPIGSTSGTLTVEPYSTCNSPTDYQLASSKSLNIQVVALPDVSMQDTTFFNCYSDSSWLTLSTSNIGATYYIYNSTDTTFNDSLLFEINTLPPVFPIESYIGVVIEPINQCTSSDTSAFIIDTVAIDLSGTFGVNPSFITCNSSNVQINCSVPNANIYWEYNADPTVPLPNPFNIYSTDSLEFTLYATKLSNGCLSSDSLIVPTDTSTTSGGISGYTGLNFPLDSLSCNNPTLNLTCEALNGTAEWLLNGTPTGSDGLNLTVSDTIGQINNIGIFQYQTTKTSTGCEQVFEVAIYFDFDDPFVAPHQGSPSINCSDSIAQVIHLSSGNPIEGWLDEFGIQTLNDTLFASNAGEYYYQVEGTNGCLNTDSVVVGQTLEMTINMPLDTLICPDETVSITAVPIINTGEVPTYLWSNGSTSNIGTAIGNMNSQLSVIVQTTSGCIGYDTTEILVTDPITAYFSSSAGCSSGAIQVDSLFGGNGNYEFSLDQINWQMSPAFTNVGVGTNDVYIRDDLGCIYTFQEIIDPASGGLNVNFLAPTYNDLGDTAVAVSFESFLGFDSLNWIAPNGAIIAFESDSLIAFTMDTEGWYDLTLVGYSDTCQYSTTYQLYFGASVQFDSITNDRGIQSINIYPNPSNGSFTVDLELGEVQNYSIQILSPNGQPIQGMAASGIGVNITESFLFPAGTVSGSYMIHFICDYDIEQETIILN